MSERKFIYILALIQYLEKIHLSHLIFDWDRLMDILAIYLIFPGSISELNKMIRKQIVRLYIILPTFRRNAHSEIWFAVIFFAFPEGQFKNFLFE